MYFLQQLLVLVGLLSFDVLLWFSSLHRCITGGEDHLTQCLGDPGPPSWHGPDLWRNHGPAVGENGTYSTLLYGPEAVKIVKQHQVSN